MQDYTPLGVVSRSELDPPVSPEEGDRYIMPAGTLTGDWASFAANSFALYESADWVEDVPAVGQTAFVEDEEVYLLFRARNASSGNSDGEWIEENPKEKLAAPLTLYVRSTGDDSNDGRSEEFAVFTITKAIERATLVDRNGFDITIDADEVRTFTENVQLLRLFGGGRGNILGDSSGNTILDPAAGACVLANNQGERAGVGEWFINRILLAGADNGIEARGDSQIELGADVDFTAPGNQIDVRDGAHVWAESGYKISGDADAHVYVENASYKKEGNFVVDNTPAFGEAFINVGRHGSAVLDPNYSGDDSTGVRFSVARQGLLDVDVGSGSVFDDLPGDARGIVAVGGLAFDGTVTLDPVRNVTDATTDPGVSDDESQYWDRGSRWVNATHAREFVLIDPTEGAADWRLVGGVSASIEVPPQALINNFFQVWQRGKPLITPASGTYLADRWGHIYDGSGATRTISEQTYNAGDEELSLSRSYMRWLESVAGTGETFKALYQKIPGVRTLAGREVRVAILAKATTSLSIAVSLQQNFGTGGSPSTAVNYAVDTLQIGTDWEVHETTSAVLSDLTGKTIGSNLDDYLGLFLTMPLNTTFQVDIGAVWLVEETAALPNAISFEEELERCLPFFQKSFAYDVAPAQNVGAVSGEYFWPANKAGALAQIATEMRFQRKMRATPTITTYNPAAASAQVRDETASVNCTSTSAIAVTRNGFVITFTGNASTAVGNSMGLHWKAEAEL